jgi:hypothetical protein
MINVVFTQYNCDEHPVKRAVTEVVAFYKCKAENFVDSHDQKDIIDESIIVIQWKSPDYHGIYMLRLGTFNLYEAYLEIDGKTYKYLEMIKNFDRINGIIENEKTKLALEKLA